MRCDNVTIRNKSDVVFKGMGVDPITVVNTGQGGDGFRIEAPATRIRIENFSFVPSNGEFNEGVGIALVPDQLVRDITLKDVKVLDATRAAGIVVGSPGTNVCLVNTEVVGSGTAVGVANGYRIRVDRTDGTLTGLQFIGGSATDNTRDGYAIEHENPTGVVGALFDGASAERNDWDGFDVSGGTTVLLDVTSSENGGDPEHPDQGRGINVYAGSLHIENAHIVRNRRAGINAGDRTARILASTLADNDRDVQNPANRNEITSAASLFVYNTIANGTGLSVAISGGTPNCNYNLFSGDSDGCFGNHSIRGSPIWEDPEEMSHLASTSRGVDEGVNLKTDAAVPEEVRGTVRRAQSFDHEGSCRPQDGNGDGVAKHEIGAFERSGATCMSSCTGDCNCNLEVTSVRCRRRSTFSWVRYA